MVNKQKGFTLIELLVVIAIIGILSSIVLASLNAARSKGNFAKVQAQVNAARTAAENYYSTNASYNTSGANVTTCANNTMFKDQTSGFRQYTDSSNYPSNTTFSCQSPAAGSSYAFSATWSGQSFCVDSQGNATTSTATITSGTATC